MSRGVCARCQKRVKFDFAQRARQARPTRLLASSTLVAPLVPLNRRRRACPTRPLASREARLIASRSRTRPETRRRQQQPAHRKKTNNEPRTRPHSTRRPQAATLWRLNPKLQRSVASARLAARALALSQTGSDSRGRRRPCVGLLDEKTNKRVMPVGAAIALPCSSWISSYGARKTIIPTHVHGGPLFSREETGQVGIGGTTRGRFALFPRRSSSFPHASNVSRSLRKSRFDLGALRLGRGFLLVGASWSDGGSVTRK